MLYWVKETLSPKVSQAAKQLIDEGSVRDLNRVLVAIAFFELVSLAIIVSTRPLLGGYDPVSVASVMFCLLTCLTGSLLTRRMMSSWPVPHARVVLFKVVIYVLLTVWAIWVSHRQYLRDEQLLTFYALEIMMTCFITIRPSAGIPLAGVAYALLYCVLYATNGAAGINPINYAVLAVVTMIGLTVRYFSAVQAAEATVRLKESKDTEVREKMDILKSMADIYDNVNIIDFTDGTEMSVRDRLHQKREIQFAEHTYTLMSQSLRQRIIADQLEEFIEFTDISTVRDRLVGKKLLSGDFIDVADGWIRAQYIPADFDADGVPLRIIFTTRNVDDEKRHEEQLVRVAMTDELTGLFNRRGWEEDIVECTVHGFEPDFVVLSADVNGLKRVNDTMGHAAGDELIKGAAECLLLAIGNKGRVYRTGGDEFASILYTDTPELVRADIAAWSQVWRGRHSETMSISVGYASHRDYPDLGIRELEKLADEDMYRAKAKHYEKIGYDRAPAAGGLG